MHVPETEKQLRELLTRLCEGTASAEQQAWLREALLEKRHVRLVYAEFMAAEATIAAHVIDRWDERRTTVPDLVDYDQVFQAGSTEPVTLQVDEMRQKASVLTQLDRAIQWHRHPLRFLVAVSMLTVLFIGGLLAWIWPQEQARRNVASPSASYPDGRRSVAQVINIHEMSEQVHSVPVFVGAYLRSNQTIRLESGLAKVRFQSGTEVILEGPAVFRCNDRNAATLESGSLVAMVPKPAHGFLIETPWGTVVDLGTEFGVQINDQESTVEVFDGKVNVQARQARQRMQLAAGESVQVVSAGLGKHARLLKRSRQADAKQFVRRLPSRPVEVVAKYTDGTPGRLSDDTSLFAGLVSKTDLVNGTADDGRDAVPGPPNAYGATLLLNHPGALASNRGVSDGLYLAGKRAFFTQNGWALSEATARLSTATYAFAHPVDVTAIHVYHAHHHPHGLDVLVEVNTGKGFTPLVDTGPHTYAGEIKLTIAARIQPGVAAIAKNVEQLRLTFDSRKLPNHFSMIREIDVFGQPTEGPRDEVSRD